MDLGTLQHHKVSREIGKPINSLGSSKTAELTIPLYPAITNSKDAGFFVTKYCKLLITKTYSKLQVQVLIL